MAIQYQFSKEVTIPYVLRELKHLTFPPFERKVTSSNISEPLLCVQAINKHHEIVGVTLAEADISKPFSEVISLYVRPDYQNQGIGSKLLEMIRKACMVKNEKEVRLFYRSNWNTREKLEHMLQNLGWSDPEIIMEIYKSHIRAFAKVKWPVLTELPDDYSITFWVDMTEEDQQFITKQMQQEKTDPYLSPLANTRNIEKSNSLLLRHQGNPAGWLISYRNSKDSVEYNNLHIFKAHRKNPRIPMLMLHKAITIQLEKNIPEAIWVIGKHHKQMIGYIQRYFGEAILDNHHVMVSVFKG